MIKINLLGQVAPDESGSAGRGSVFTSLTQTLASPMSGTGTGDVAIKLLVALGPLVVLIGTEQWVVGTKRQELEKIQQELSLKQAQIEANKKDVEQVQKFREDKVQLDQRMNTIQNLSKARLKNVKALDAIQNIIPTRAWLMALKLEENKVELKGRAMEDADISSFMKGLEENIYFLQVQLISSNSVKTEDGVVKEFNIAASLENL